nr:MAG TPA: hypothetical protein [Caudoviricetes sp.]
MCKRFNTWLCQIFTVLIYHGKPVDNVDSFK